jgi:hypothetical protein
MHGRSVNDDRTSEGQESIPTVQGIHLVKGSFKPGVPRAVHLFAAPFLWTTIGCLLIIRGLTWIDSERGLLLVVIAGCLGTLKSLCILDATAQRSILRILHFKEKTCLGAVYSWKTWLLVALMIGAGYLFRQIPQSGNSLGILYCSIGWALCLSSRYGWYHWYRLLKNDELA